MTINKSEKLSQLKISVDSPRLIKVKQDFRKQVKQKEGYWILINGEWQRIDTNIELAKATLKNLKANQRK